MELHGEITAQHLWNREDKLFKAYIKSTFPNIKALTPEERKEFYKSKKKDFKQIFRIVVDDRRAFLTELYLEKQVVEFKERLKQLTRVCKNLKK